MFKKLRCIILAVLIVLQSVFTISPLGYAASAKSNSVSDIVIEGVSTPKYEAAKKTAKITKQPASIVVPKGKTAKVTLTATGDGLKYTWYYKNAKDKKYTKTTSFKENSYSLTMSASRSGRKVYCVVKDKYGNSVKSNVATITMGNPVKIKKQPVSVKRPSGMTAKVSFTATGDGLKYTWYYKDSGDTKYKKTTSFKSNSYSLKMTSAKSGRKVYCIVKDKYGNSERTKTVSLTMGKTLKITKQPTSVKAAGGSTAKVSFTVTGDGLTYKWYFKNKGASKFSLTKSFTGSSYSLKMSSSNNGRQVYCEITDAYGKKVKTNTVTLSVGKELKITKQPKNIIAHNDETATVKFTASGDGLTYAWYFKDAKSSKFSLTKSFTSNTYSLKMNSSRDGRQVYCVVTDAYGKSVKTNTVTLSTAHEMGDWETYIEATVEEEGVERSKCKKCSYYKDRISPKLTAIYFITVNTGVGDAYKVGVAANGKYSLKAPKKIGYNFEGFKDSNGNDFALSGIVKKNIVITAKWGLDGTNTLEELIERTDAGVDKINITSDIVVDKTIYVSYQTTIYSDSNYSLIRDPDFEGDIIIVGKTREGESSVWFNRYAKLTLGGGKGTLTIDGNMENMEVTVTGGAVFACQSATLDLYDGINIINNKKIGNKNAYEYGEDGKPTYGTQRIGGAAIIILDSTVNMYGGLLGNNVVATEYTVVPNDQGVEESLEYNACGGAVYNRGNFNMYGGKITNNTGLRGGAIYNDRYAYLYAGEISDNLSTVYGGAIASSSSMNANLFIGTEEGNEKFIIKNNYSYRAGGALYSNTNSPIIVLGNTEFIGNHSDSSGGAIYTAGPLTINDTVFDGNYCTYSGGTIYHHYTKEEYSRRELEISNSEFRNNKANLGGAIVLSNSGTVSEKGEEGTFAKITNCNFSKNQAVSLFNEEGAVTAEGNGGAIYVTRKSDAIISDCEFTENTAANNAGALAMHSESTIDIFDCSFTSNSAAFGGAAYASSGADLNFKNITFTSNSANLKENGTGGNGGAFFIDRGIINDATIKFDNVDFIENSAALNAGALYQNATEITLDSSCEFDGNTAVGHGGAIYLTYTKLDENDRVGSIFNANGITFKNHSALAGGVISIRTDCKANFEGCTFLNNTATGATNDAQGGGAVYVGFGELNLINVTATENSSAGFGGVVNAIGAVVTTDTCSFNENSAYTGGAINASNSSELEVESSNFLKNVSKENPEVSNAIGGGALAVTGSKLQVGDSIFDANETDYYGAAILASKSEVTINNKTVVKNSSGKTGAALYFRNGSTITLDDIEITNNISNANGVVYANSSILTANKITASQNEGNKGGVFFISGATTVINVNGSTFSDNSAINGGVLYSTDATINLNDSKFESNQSNNGGAIFSAKGIIDIKKGVFTENTALRNVNNGEGHGGAISNIGATLITDNETQFVNNSAENHAGAIYVSYYTNEDKTRVVGVATINGGVFQKNTAMGGGAVSVRSGCEATFNGSEFIENSVEGYDLGTTDKPGINDGDMEGGGAIYVGYGTVTLNNVIASNNSASDFGGALDSVSSTVNVVGGTFSGNEALNGGAVYAITSSKLNITDAKFTGNASTYVNSDYNNAVGGGAINQLSGELTINGTTFDGNSSDYYGGAVMTSSSKVIIGGNTVFKNSNGGTGAALNIKSTSSTLIENTQFIDNTASSNGVVYLSGGKYELSRVTANGNKAYQGGVIYTSGASTEIIVNNSDLIENNATNGGVIFADKATIKFNGGNAKNNTASKGGAIYGNGAKVFVDATNFDNNTVTSAAGAIYINEGEIEVKNAKLTNNKANHNGGALYAALSEASIVATEFSGNTSAINGGAIDFIGTTATIDENSKFINNSAVKHGGAIYVVYFRPEATNNENVVDVPSTLTMTGGEFEANTAMGGGAVSVRTGCEATFNATEFKKNSVEGYDEGTTETPGINDGDMEGGGAIYVGYGTVTLNNVTASENSASDFGGVVDSVMSTVTINGGSYVKNKTYNGGVIFATNKSVVNIDDAAFTENESNYIQGETANSKFGGGAVYILDTTLNVNNSTFDKNKTDYYGGAIYASRSTVYIGENTIVSGSNGKTGAALYFREGCNTTIENTTIKDNVSTANGVVYQNAGTLVVDGITATNNESYNGGVLFISGGTTEFEIKNSNFSGNTAVSGGVLNSGDAKGTICDCEFTNNTAQLGGALNIGSGVLEISNNTFTNNAAVKSADNANGNGGAIMIVGGKVIGSQENVFTDNSAENHGGAVYVSYINNDDKTKTGGILEMTDGLFDGNTAFAGGAISARTSATVILNGTELKNNEATGSDSNGGGGAIYANNNTITLSGVIMDSNKSPYYGGAVTALEASVTVNNKSVIKNNIGITGVAFNFRNSGTYVLDDITVTGNEATDNGSGVIYITGSGTLTVSKLTASGNYNNNGAVLFASGSTRVELSNSTITNNEAKSNGGAIYHSSSGTFAISNTVISNNKAKYGGAIHAHGTGLLTINGCEIKGNTATESGGAINAGTKETNNEVTTYRAGNIKITNNTLIEGNTSVKPGGAIYINYGSIVEVENSIIKQNTVTGVDANGNGNADGGAIYVADSSAEGNFATTFKANGVTFEGNTASSKGGAISTDTSSTKLVINVVNSVFKANKSLGAGGGAVEIQNGNQNTATDPEKINIVFTNCTFTENESKTTGGAIEIRTNSAAKFDGLTATKNKGNQNGGVIYVTSNFSRLYLAGEITLSENTTGQSGAFVYLYNNSYTNPPKIYTTNSNSAAWVSGVGGNKSNIVFDLVTLP